MKNTDVALQFLRPTLTEQLACAKRELALRQRVYPKWIQEGRLSQIKSDHEIQCMAEIVNSIEKLKNLQEVSEEMKCRG